MYTQEITCDKLLCHLCNYNNGSLHPGYTALKQHFLVGPTVIGAHIFQVVAMAKINIWKVYYWYTHFDEDGHACTSGNGN